MNSVAQLIKTMNPDTPVLVMVGDLQQWEREVRAAERERLAAILERRETMPESWFQVAGIIRGMVKS